MKKTVKSQKDPTKDMTMAEEAALARQAKNQQVSASLKDTEAGKIWSEIKDLDIEMFALPGQKVHMHCSPVEIDPSKLYLNISSSAVLPSLEVAVGSKYTVEMTPKFLIVSRAAPPTE